MSLIASLLGIALFARQYGVTCQKCHTVIPHLTAFGARFLAAGDRMPGVSSGGTLPLASKVNLIASSENQGPGLPKAIVDEIELFSSGTLGARGSFFIEQYVLDGGTPGATREAWVNDRITPWSARVPVAATAGMFTLPLPVDPETFRETAQHYAIYDQTVGNNPFNFFDPKYGVKIVAGDTLHGLSAQIFAGPGYDRLSGLPKTGTDTMEYVADSMGALTLSLYHYRGERPDSGPLRDRFSRTGYGVVYDRGKWTSETVLQSGFDSSVNGAGVASSGGFTQLRYAFDRRLFALARYEGTNQPGASGRDAVFALGYGPTRNSRITVEDVLVTQPVTTHTLNTQVTVGL